MKRRSPGTGGAAHNAISLHLVELSPGCLEFGPLQPAKSGGYRRTNCLDEMLYIMDSCGLLLGRVDHVRKHVEELGHDVQHFIKTVGPPVASRCRLVGVRG